MGKREVNVHCCTGLVNLGNAETDPDLMVLETFLNTLISDARSDPFAKLADVRPRAGCFEALSCNEVILGEISGVSNQEGKQITSHSVLRAGSHTFVLFSDFHNQFVIIFAFDFVAFKEKRTGNKFVFLVPFDVEDEEFLSAFNERFPFAVTSWFKGGAELKLNIVYKSARGGPTVGFAHVIHELDSAFPIVENN